MLVRTALALACFIAGIAWLALEHPPAWVAPFGLALTFSVALAVQPRR